MVATPLDGKDHIQMNFNIKGKSHTFKIHKNRFEKTVDGIDKMVHSGRHDVESITRKFGSHFVDKPTATVEPVKSKAKKTADVVKSIAGPSNSSFDKKAHVAKHVNEYPQLSASAIAKTSAATSGGHLSYANAYFYARKLKSAK